MAKLVTFIFLVISPAFASAQDTLPPVDQQKTTEILRYLEQSDLLMPEEMALLKKSIDRTKGELSSDQFIKLILNLYIQGDYSKAFYRALHDRLLAHYENPSPNDTTDYAPVKDTFGGFWVANEDFDINEASKKLIGLCHYFYQKQLITDETRKEASLLVKTKRIFELPLFIIELDSLSTRGK